MITEIFLKDNTNYMLFLKSKHPIDFLSTSTGDFLIQRWIWPGDVLKIERTDYRLFTEWIKKDTSPHVLFAKLFGAETSSVHAQEERVKQMAIEMYEYHVRESIKYLKIDAQT
jgi:hypothetical protein